jgi:4-hydroxy-3-polyprenylbenzoate decarboxylase
VTHRRNAVFPATVVGLPPQEDYYMGKATERIFLPLLKTLIHDIEDYHLPMFGCFHNCAFIKIRKAYPLQARRVMHAIWGAGQMSWTKFIVVVDDDVNVHDETAVLRAMLERCDFRRDLELVNGPLDILDHAAPRLGAGSKMGIDATRKVVGEEVNGIAVREGSHALEVLPSAAVTAGWWESMEHVCVPDWGGGRCAFVSVQKERAGDGARAIESLWDQAPEGAAEFVIAVDSSVHCGNWEEVLFHWCANCDPGRDMVRRDGRIGFDATKKMPGDERNAQPVREYPPILQMSDEVRERVERRKREFGLE